MPAILSDFQKDLAARKMSVKAEYKSLTRDGSSKTEVVNLLSKKYRVSTVTIYSYLKS